MMFEKMENKIFKFRPYIINVQHILQIFRYII